MKSFCIKSNNQEFNNYLLENFKKYALENFRLSYKKFKIYNNIILHFKEFNNTFGNILSEAIIKFYEKDELKKIIQLNYFYFSKIEQSIILNDCLKYITKNEISDISNRKDLIYDALLKYINENDSFIIDGFINFRLKNYKEILEYIVDTCVNNFLIEKEYNEFINLLKIYINSRKSNCNIIHLLYKNHNSILLDDAYNEISTKDYLLDAAYLSDISFSSNDYTLNTLLNLLPKKITIHIIDDSDEFIETLKLIFEKKVSICKHCSLCTKYKLLNSI